MSSSDQKKNDWTPIGERAHAWNPHWTAICYPPYLVAALYLRGLFALFAVWVDEFSEFYCVIGYLLQLQTFNKLSLLILLSIYYFIFAVGSLIPYMFYSAPYQLSTLKCPLKKIYPKVPQIVLIYCRKLFTSVVTPDTA